MGILFHLDERRPRTAGPSAAPISVTAFGFCIGPTFVPWQAVSMIHASRVHGTPSDDVVLEFAAHGQCLPVRAAQPGFAALEAAMTGAFPETTGWREALQTLSRPRGRTLLYQRP
ncbi:hypothetical protein [Aerolutibacter daejeonensis]|uniref:hypothetical protein n=1 Tax=Aerolutibacter daejeonensis TaxID=346181 RepID=UPI000B1EA84E|nr:hypothetical protein [Lysobacter daejeonensis]